MVKFYSSKSIPYTKFDSLVNNDCESGLHENSTEEYDSHIKTEESGHNYLDDSTEKDLMAITTILFVSTSFMVSVRNSINPNEWSDKAALILFSPILLLTIITLGVVICKERKSNVHLLEKWWERKQGYIASDMILVDV